MSRYSKVVLGSNSNDNQTRIWLEGTPKEIVAKLLAKGFEAVTKRPLIEKAAKATKVKAKAGRARKEPVAA